MPLLRDLCSLVLVFAGCAFFLAGTAGLWRFPDLFTRLHALSKSDNLGLGLVVLGLLLQAEEAAEAVRLVAIWLLAMGAGSTTSHLIAAKALQTGERPWQP